MDLHEQNLGAEASLKLKLSDGNLVLTLHYDGKGADADISVTVGTDYFLDKLAEMIPGQVDDAIIAILKGALKAASPK